MSRGLGDVYKRQEVKNVYALPKYMQEQLDKGTSLIYFTMKDTKDFTAAALSYVISGFAMEGKEIYAGPTMVIGDKTLYSITVDQYMETQGELDPKVQEKLQKAMDKLGLVGSEGFSEPPYEDGKFETLEGVDE